ncbi:MAG: TVP38/TMEM64 family protein [Bacillota bacterium]|nr:TVP38/TMEM64 family protein [Bacillota bacterium]
MSDGRRFERLTRWLTILMTVAIVLLAIRGWQLGLFTSLENLQALVARLGPWGPVAFVLLQIVQVVVPMIPGGITLGAGVLLFGPWLGWVYNYIGICLGSFAIFALMRTFGKPLALRLIGEKTISRYSGWLNDEKRFGRLFALAIFFPFAPDDALCYLAGLSNMSWRRYSLIILLGKPLSIALYSFSLTSVFNWLAMLQLQLGK